jgi:glycosyltransferase involved in cell wall biosynthesis
MKKNILFIADSSLRNPILQSQGFPFLYNLNHVKYKPFVLSFEESNLSKKENIELKSVIKKYDSKINFLPVTINKKGILPFWFYFIWKRSKILHSIVRKYDIMLLHARSFNPAFLAIIIKIIFKPSIKVIYDNRGLYIDELIFRNALSKGSLKEKIYRTIEMIIINKCDQMVVVSNVFKSYIVEQLGKRNKNIISKTSMIPNRTQINFNDSDNVFRQKRTKDRTICVYSGSSASWQGTDDFYKVFSIILNRIPTTYFKILTYEPELFLNHPPENIKLAERLMVEKVEFCNVKSELINATFGIHLRKSDVVSRVSAPIKFAEYLSAGLPVILREGIGDTEQVIKKYNVGVIIKKNDYESAISELQELLNDKDVYHRCLRIADKEFNINISFKQYQEIYDKL